MHASHCITDPSAIDLTRHALIEASAGTGKTYTIENLVVRLILERSDMGIENILLVTFTEKAAGELKVRIREKIEEQFFIRKKENAGQAEVLKKALDNFDQAAVFTIHGFCQTLLSELAFENNALFENEVKEDQAIYESLLKDQVRRVWPARYGAYLPELLHLCRFAVEKDRLLDKIVSLARSISPTAGDRLAPQTEFETYEQLRRHLESAAERLARLLAGPPLFSEAYNKLNIHGGTRKSLIQKIIGPLERLFLERSGQELDMARLAVLFRDIAQVKSGQNKGLGTLSPAKWTGKGPNETVCPHLDAMIAAAEELETLVVAGGHWIVRETVLELKQSVTLKKEQQGWISFDDMLVRVYTALFSQSAELLLARIREKYKIAFVDEFQDTDPIQWRIFRRIFIDDETPETCHPLIIIGDPKQAIYSFRGADVYAYLEARAALSRLAEKGRSNIYSLGHNWRSLPELIEGFNRIFSQKTWFCTESDAAEFEIGYSPALSPGEEKLPFGVAKDDTGRAGLNLIDLRRETSSPRAKKALSRFIASEISRLAAGKALWLVKKGGTQRLLDYGDIAVLVRNKAEARFIEQDLRAANIPFSFYKKPGLFQSEQAEELSLVLHAVMDPGNGDKVKKALLTPFFEADPLFLYTYNDLPVTHPVRQLLLLWNDLAAKRRWRPLFQSLLEASGLIFRLSPQPEWDRIHTNFSQIFEQLESDAYRRNLDFRAVLALLDSYRNQTLTAEEGANIHQIETEARKVQIMTMHVSKGLQFPVVFIAGGLTQPFQADYHVFHQPSLQRSDGTVERVFDLARQNRKAHEKEQEDEDRRLFYVALTRAQIKLYLPYYPAQGASLWVGPLSKFVAKAVGAAFDEKKDPGPVTWIEAGTAPLFESAHETSYVAEKTRLEKRQTGALSLPPQDNFLSRKIHLNSFTSLNARLSASFQETSAQEFHPNLIAAKDSDDDWGEHRPVETHLWAPASSPPEDSNELPGGPQMGSMLHDILEQIDYSSIRREPEKILETYRTERVISRIMSLYRVDTKWRQTVADLIVAALTTPIKVAGREFILGDLPKNQRLHEVEFYFPYIWDDAPPLSGRDRHYHLDCNGYIRGVIDLIFRHDDQYFIADWKSNRLADGYGQAALNASMEHAGYHLQYRIYSLALLRWLENALGGISKALDQFGGVFYFYLRGMGSGEDNGIFYAAPEALGSRQRLEKELEEILRRTSSYNDTM